MYCLSIGVIGDGFEIFKAMGLGGIGWRHLDLDFYWTGWVGCVGAGTRQ
jgi:hypothetical protein